MVIYSLLFLKHILAKVLFKNFHQLIFKKNHLEFAKNLPKTHRKFHKKFHRNLIIPNFNLKLIRKVDSLTGVQQYKDNYILNRC